MPMGFGSYAGKTVATNVVATDGTGDYTDIQTAINALPAGGGVVYVKEGTYTLTETLVINKSNVALLGAGAAAIIKLGADVDDHVITLGDNATIRTSLLIADLLVDGNKANNAGNIDGIFLAGKIEDSKITGCWVKDCDQHGIRTHSNCNRNIITENTCVGNDDYGIYIINSSEPNIVSNNSCNSNGNSGIVLLTTTGPVFATGNICTQNTVNGISLSCNSSTINNNICTGNTEDGIYLNAGIRNSIIGNSCKGNGHHGIEIRSASWNTLVGNTCTQNSQTTANTYDGIRLSLTCTYNSITGNTVFSGDVGNRHKYGINEESAAANYNIILGNILNVAGVTANTRVQGANTIEQHNQE